MVRPAIARIATITCIPRQPESFSSSIVLGRCAKAPGASVSRTARWEPWFATIGSKGDHACSIWSSLTKDPRLHRTLVYGNLLLATKRTSSRIVHYGGDNGDEATYRKGTLYFYANTTIVTADESDNWHTCLLHLETNDESADVRDNILYRVGSTHLAWGYEKGVLKLGANWVSPDVAKGRDNFEGKFEYLDGKNQLTVGDDPGFVDFGKKNFCLRKDSPARGLGQPLASELGQDLAPVRQYQSVGKAIPRAWKGTGDDLGAFACP